MPCAGSFGGSPVTGIDRASGKTPGGSLAIALAVLPAIPAILLYYLGAFDLGANRGVSLLAAGALAYAVILAILFRLGRAKLSDLQQQALTDSLCGLPNRRALHREVGQRDNREDEVAIAMIDLDGFKSVNDFYGHNVGDRVIKACADMLTEMSRDNGRAYRLGGDEFALVVSGPLAGNILEGICRRLLVRFEAPLVVDERPISLGASIGLARSTGKGEHSSSNLLRCADVAMYASKSRGKMRVTWFSEEFDRRRDEHQQIDTDLREALVEGQLYLHYQPLVDAGSGKVSAVEALIRWERPDGQCIGPDQFIPVAEETGLIEAIGLWVLRQACTDALAWEGIKLSVNVSVAQLRNPQFPLQMAQILEETGFPTSRLELEITETFLVGDATVPGRNLAMIKDFGVSIVLDDYGTGYASIGFLRRFSFEKLKLDRTLIVDATGDHATRTVMSSSVAMAKALGMTVTAEGIENEGQATLARAAGCDQMQGWLYSKAIPADEIAQFIDDMEVKSDARQPDRAAAAG